MKAALLGFMQSGKSTLLAAVSGRSPAAPGVTRGVEAAVPVPDERLAWLTELYKPKKTVCATIDCLDTPGLNLADTSGRSASRGYLSQVRTADVLVLVVRAFEDECVPAYRGSVSYERDVKELTSELLLADLEVASTRVTNLEKQVLKPTKTQEEDEAELEFQRKLLAELEQERPAADVITTAEEHRLVRSLNLFTLKPFIVALNVDEGQQVSNEDWSVGLDDSVPVMAVSAKLEYEIAQLDDASRQEFMDDLGIKESAAGRFVRSCYHAMGLISFLTVGEDEVRAWPVRHEAAALEAAGKIHSDIQRGFIRAETMAYTDLHELGSEKAVRAAGKLRLEGKEYVVQDGDIMDFRFNV